MPKINTTERFFQVGISRVYFALAIADKANITRAEITAAKDLTDEIAGITGFGVSSGTIDTPDLGNRFIKKIGGRINTDDSSLTFWADREGDDARKDLPRGTKGYLIFCDHGDAATLPADIFEVEVTSVGKVRSVDEQGFQLTVNFANTGVPAEDVALPAAA